ALGQSRSSARFPQALYQYKADSLECQLLGTILFPWPKTHTTQGFQSLRKAPKAGLTKTFSGKFFAKRCILSLKYRR
ncbi:hypothetical protein, partial [Phormidium tenue]|uniref:hypothetical protein n=1 Tax=Phormidium tenue TaxID=126344 RepID=UPI001C0DFA56